MKPIKHLFIISLIIFVLVSSFICEEIKKPIFSSYEIDSEVAQTILCGGPKKVEKMLTLTVNGSVLLSDNMGLNWTIIDDQLQKTGSARLDKATHKVGNVRKIVKSSDNNTLFFIGTNYINWVSSDCGTSINAINQGRPINEVIFNPIEPNWIIATAFTQPEDGVEVHYKELFISKNRGLNWSFLIDHIEDVSWGCLNYNNFEYGISKERIILTRNENGVLNLMYSDDLFSTPITALKNVEKFILDEENIYASIYKEDKSLMLKFASLKHFTFQFKPVIFNSLPHLIHSHYSFLKLEKGIVINVSHIVNEESVGDIYISNGGMFGHSIQHNVKQDQLGMEFISVSGLDGVFISNVIEEEENEEKRLINMSSIKTDKAELNIVTKISFNNGVSWHKLIAPEYDSNGKKYNTNLFNLHLKGLNSKTTNHIFTKKNAIGLILANGNVNTKLISKTDGNKQETNLFLSRDGGISWKEIMKEEQLFNIGDHGGVIITANKSATNFISYSLDEGQTFSKLEITIDPIYITSIDNLIDSVVFLIYGNDIKGNGVVISINFEEAFERKCINPEYPNREFSDYETWSPHGDTRIVGYECLNGQMNTYIRRKAEKKCFNGLDFDTRIISKPCKCVESDYTCDLGYRRYTHFGPCIKEFDHPEVNKKDNKGCIELNTRGYRKIYGNKCEEGVDLSPIKRQCKSNYNLDNLSYLGTCLIIVFLFISFLYFYIIKFLERPVSRTNLMTESQSKSLEMQRIDLNESQRLLKNKHFQTSNEKDIKKKK